MLLVKWGFIGLILLPAAEIAAFVIVALWIGWVWATCLFLATTLLGILILRRSGRRDLDRFRAALTRDGIRAIHLESPGLGPVIAGILLLIPGFITDAAGALLLIPAVRRRLRATISRARERRRRERDPSLIDLSPQDWHQVSNKPLDHGRSRKSAR